MEHDNSFRPPTPANENADPLATGSSALDWLYQIRREMLRIDPSTLSFARRREQQNLLTRFPEVEKLLLATL